MGKVTKYTNEVEDEDGWTRWINPNLDGYKISCCDCGLVHVLQFKIEGDRVLFRAHRDNRATGQKRRKMKCLKTY